MVEIQYMKYFTNESYFISFDYTCIYYIFVYVILYIYIYIV